MLSQSVVDLSNRDLLALLVGEKTADDMLLITRGRLSELFASETMGLVAHAGFIQSAVRGDGFQKESRHEEEVVFQNRSFCR